MPASKATERDFILANLQFQKLTSKANPGSGMQPSRVLTLCSDVRMLVYEFLNQDDLILKVSKLGKKERERLKNRSSCEGYALVSSINTKKSLQTALTLSQA